MTINTGLASSGALRSGESTHERLHAEDSPMTESSTDTSSQRMMDIDPRLIASAEAKGIKIKAAIDKRKSSTVENAKDSPGSSPSPGGKQKFKAVAVG